VLESAWENDWKRRVWSFSIGAQPALQGKRILVVDDIRSS
jgi:hypothetical protein